MLHIVNKSPFEKNSMDTCLRLANQGSDIILIENAVYAAIEGSDFESKLSDAIKNHTVFALEPDMNARGIDKAHVMPGVEIVGYDGFVKLVENNELAQSWL